ncbi:DNA phosphorothioation-dependent restriction protein DptG [Fredinandcohnia aciditolerans]|uniref:DNA phosphorothioation-dependent restriction protein DptG n=1 Tax=Ferdinandcohnia sp. SAFN-114 TaxID=3387275 RepID=UPI000EABA633
MKPEVYTLEALRKSLSVKTKNGKKTLKHTINKRVTLLPFKTRNPERAKFANGFAPVIGEFFRLVEEKTYHKTDDENELDIETFITKVSENVQMNEEDRPYFEDILKTFLYSANGIRLFHPMMFKYLLLSDSKEATGEKDIAQYIYDVLLKHNSQILEEILQIKENEHVLVRLIHKLLPELKAGNTKETYAMAFPFIKDLFLEDLRTLTLNRDFFMNNISLFIAYYYFFSVTQLTLKLNQYEEMDKEVASPVFYNLDWEATNRNRKATTNGFKLITEASKQLLSHMNTLEHVNYLLNQENLLYKDLVQHFETLAEADREKVYSNLFDWTKEYSEIVLNNVEGIEQKGSLEEAYRQLQKQISLGLTKETISRYALYINEIGKVYFLKTRGSLGYTLNVTQDFLLLLTAVSVKQEKISLKQLFVEFERRGVYFDRYSREEIIKLFNKLNLIEKKSDSGDAQYVKPILSIHE